MTRPTAAEVVLTLLVTATPGQRDLLLLMLGGADLDEAAARLGIARAAVDVRLHRLRRRAAALLAAEEKRDGRDRKDPCDALIVTTKASA